MSTLNESKILCQICGGKKKPKEGSYYKESSVCGTNSFQIWVCHRCAKKKARVERGGNVTENKLIDFKEMNKNIYTKFKNHKGEKMIIDGNQVPAVYQEYCMGTVTAVMTEITIYLQKIFKNRIKELEEEAKCDWLTYMPKIHKKDDMLEYIVRIVLRTGALKENKSWLESLK